MSGIDIPVNVSAAGIAVAIQILDAVVRFPEFEKIQLSTVADINLMSEIRMPSGVIVLAEPGMGKTLLLDLIRRSLTQMANFFDKARPVLSVSLDSAVDSHKFAAKLMFALGYPMLPSRPNLESMTHMVDMGIERLKPKALLVDECQHMCEGNRDITARALTDWLKVRMDKHNLPFVGTGTNTFERIGEINPQFISRSSAKYTINAFQIGDAWSQLIQAFESVVTKVDLKALKTTGMLKATHAATFGNLRSLKKLLVYACINAADRPQAVLTTEDMEVGFDRAFGLSSRHVNPFRTKRL
ncbi:MAG: TniB family NTP-binding protein [Rhodoferax sp.]